MLAAKDTHIGQHALGSTGSPAFQTLTRDAALGAGWMFPLRQAHSAAASASQHHQQQLAPTGVATAASTLAGSSSAPNQQQQTSMPSISPSASTAAAGTIRNPYLSYPYLSGFEQQTLYPAGSGARSRAARPVLLNTAGMRLRPVGPSTFANVPGPHLALSHARAHSAQVQVEEQMLKQQPPTPMSASSEQHTHCQTPPVTDDRIELAPTQGTVDCPRLPATSSDTSMNDNQLEMPPTRAATAQSNDSSPLEAETVPAPGVVKETHNSSLSMKASTLNFGDRERHIMTQYSSSMLSCGLEGLSSDRALDSETPAKVVLQENSTADNSQVQTSSVHLSMATYTCAHNDLMYCKDLRIRAASIFLILVLEILQSKCSCEISSIS